VNARLRTLGIAATCVLAVELALTGCSSGPGNKPSTSTGASAAPPCPTAPINVVVSVDQWGDIVAALGGNCTKVKTVLVSSSVDPHDYEPEPADAEDFSHAQLVVINGVDYDTWASKLAATSAPNATVVSAAAVTRTPDGANPHLRYSPSAVIAVTDAVTAELTQLSPKATDYFRGQRSTLSDNLKAYHQLISKIKTEASGKSYAATETVFDYMATALGLVDKTPEGYQRASANESDPSPDDVEAFRIALAGHRIDVLIYNIQTQGSMPEEIRAAAQQSGVPVVNVTETVAQGATSFQGWQEDQLDRLAKALGVAA
jgi:zinc/manganese transport system substrate-binding protein